jgi:hypothetical protein
MRTVFHVTSSDPERQSRALMSVANLLRDDTVEVDTVTVVANAGAVRMLTEGPHADRVRTLSQAGVEFRACSNSVERVGFAPSELLAPVETVTSGVGEVARLQETGYGYIRL